MDHHVTPLPYLTSPLLPFPHGCFYREGGVSPAPFDSLNLSHQVGDQAERVETNRNRIRAALHLPLLAAVKQVHADRILDLQVAHLGTEPEGYDALISTLPGVGLLIQQADCQAILLAAPGHQVVATIHCGWRGSVQELIGKTINRLTEHYGVPPAALRAVISPSLGPCCAEFIHFQRELPPWMHAFQVRPTYFDFWAISRHQLQAAGVPAEQIATAGLCTRCDPRFFSHRRATQTALGTTGRNGSLLGLP